MLPETLTSAPVGSTTRQNQVPSHLTGHLAHWQQSPSTCSLPYYLVPLLTQDESLGPPSIQEVFLAIPVPQRPVKTPPLCLHSSQLAGMKVGVYLFHSVLSASNRVGAHLPKKKMEEETQDGRNEKCRCLESRRSSAQTDPRSSEEWESQSMRRQEDMRPQVDL